MKHKCKSLLFLFITIIAFYSCGSLRKIAIQVPLKDPIPEDIQRIAILNRSMTPEFINHKIDSLERRKPKIGRFKTTFLDSSAADTSINAAARAIFGSQRFDVVVPLARNFVRDDFGSNILLPLDSARINEICKEVNVDALLVLEYFSETIERHIYRLSGYFGGALNLKYKLAWRFYQPHQETPESYVCADEIFWDSPEKRSLQKLFSNLPTIKEALIGGGLASGMDIADLICPKWVEDKRFYFVTRNKEIDAAIPLIKENKWDEAKDHWTKYSSASNPLLRSKIEFNLALTEEMTANMDLAEEWANKSLKSKYSREAEDYLFNFSRHPIKQNRYYYTTGNQEIDAAVPLIILNNWNDAARILMKNTSLPDKKLQSKVEYNLALTEEMKGNIDLAVKWGAKSLKSNNSLSTKQYLKELRQLSRYRFNSYYRISGNSYETESSMIPWILGGSLGGREE